MQHVCKYGQKCLEGCEILSKSQFALDLALHVYVSFKNKKSLTLINLTTPLSATSTMPRKAQPKAKAAKTASVDIVPPQPCASGSVGTLPKARPQPRLITVERLDEGGRQEQLDYVIYYR